MMTHHETPSPNSLREDYMRDGFVVLEGQLQALVPQLRALADAGLAKVSGELGVTQLSLQRLVSAWGWRSEIVQQLLAASLAAAHGAVGQLEPISSEPIDATLFIKSSAAPAATHAHQDIAYRWYRPPEQQYTLTAWIALDDCDGDTGALSFLAGSHREPIAVRQDFLDPAFRDRAHTHAWAQAARVVPVRAGDVVVFDARTWHAAGPFRGAGVRRALAIRWATPGAAASLDVPRPPSTPERFGMDTSGRLLLHAIHRVFPEVELDDEAGSILRTLRSLAAQRGQPASRVPEHVWQAFDELELVLSVLESHHGRPSEHAWLRIRDEVIPELERCARGGRS